MVTTFFVRVFKTFSLELHIGQAWSSGEKWMVGFVGNNVLALTPEIN
jgi:hypothetical protein